MSLAKVKQKSKPTAFDDQKKIEYLLTKANEMKQSNDKQSL